MFCFVVCVGLFFRVFDLYVLCCVFLVCCVCVCVLCACVCGEDLFLVCFFGISRHVFD